MIKKILKRFESNKDVIVKYNKKLCAYLIYQEQMCNIERFYRDYFQALSCACDTPDNLFSGVCKPFKVSESFNEIESIEQIVYSGLLIYITGKNIYVFDISASPSRQTGDSLADPDSVFGSRDGFVENYKVNIALIRTRMKTANLVIDEMYIGKRSKTFVGILSIKDIHNEDKKNELIKKIKALDIDGVTTIDDIIQLIQKKHFFPTYEYFGNPDLASRALLNGEFVVVIDRIPIVLCFPVTLELYTKLRIDKMNVPIYQFISRLLVLFCLVTSISAMGLFYSLFSYQSNSLSLLVLSTIKTTETGTFLPTFIEMGLVLFLFEMIYFLGFRQNKSFLSSTIVLIAGLIIGQNMIDSGIAGVFIVSLVAIIFLCSFIPSSNVTFILSISIYRLFLFICSLFLGMFGLTIGIIVVISLMYKEKFLGTYFFYPFIPFKLEGIKSYFFPSSSLKRRKRPVELKTRDNTMKGDFDEKA